MIYQIAAAPRKRYDVPEPFVDELGAVRYPGSEEVRRLEFLMRRALGAPDAGRTPGGLVALGVLNEVQRRLVHLYRSSLPRDPLAEATSGLDGAHGPEVVDGCLLAYVGLFPPRPPDRPLLAELRTDLLGELIFLSVTNRNPACSEYAELYSDEDLARRSAYRALLTGIEAWSGSAGPALGWDAGIIDLLMAPIRHAPGSLLDQLLYIRERWGAHLGEVLAHLLLAIDVLQEERKPRWGGPPSGPYPLPVYGGGQDEPERYSPDLGWMPCLVLIAKQTLVWLHQLSVRHGRDIRRLDEIPESELDELAAAGFTGLWLIGIWARSPASRTIKRRCGNPEAVGSAYAIVDYVVSEELGGEGAARVLSERCSARGIRLACDMVPNHTALDSRWVIEHPDWFVQTRSPPFPGYSFRSEELSEDQRVSLRIEDHYYDRSDAAVVFERTDTASGDRRYLYHGNDGTATPWNDTAQLDFLNPEVREAVTRQIIAAARTFSVIRFDAAMVLTKKHFQRLWYPPPGSGGDIPSRAERGLDAREFDQRMPTEFWRDVVDRVAAEAPQTLLLAEAFWLLEGYFVRTLGMHRVYNSAFMNMLKAEDNARYRHLIKSTLEYDPEILKRYVNFMSNPDEDPAAAQFGTGDKYFGIAVMMATLPGLPLFGHGQIEGFAEKYGMEYSRSYRDEQPDAGVVERHRREITPLLRMRWLFAEVHSFRLYDLYTAAGQVDENVFAYSNRQGSAFALVVYNNLYRQADGWLSLCAAYRDRARGDAMVRRSLGEEIGLTDDVSCFCVFRDMASGVEYVRSSRRLLGEGLRVTLPAFGYHVFLDFREVRDGRLGHYARLEARLAGAGVASVEESIVEYLAPLRGSLGALVGSLAGSTSEVPSQTVLTRNLVGLYGAILDALPDSAPRPPGAPAGLRGAARSLCRIGSSGQGRLPAGMRAYLEEHGWMRSLLGVRSVLAAMARPHGAQATGARAVASLSEELRLPEAFRRVLIDRGASAAEAVRAASLLSLVADVGGLLESVVPDRLLNPEGMLAEPAVRVYLGVNWFDGHEWFRQEPFEDLVRLMQLLGPAPQAAAGRRATPRAAPRDTTLAPSRLLARARESGYRVDIFLSASQPARRPRPAAKKPDRRR